MSKNFAGPDQAASSEIGDPGTRQCGYCGGQASGMNPVVALGDARNGSPAYDAPDYPGVRAGLRQIGAGQWWAHRKCHR